jgi:CHAT domain-containing protein
MTRIRGWRAGIMFALAGLSVPGPVGATAQSGPAELSTNAAAQDPIAAGMAEARAAMAAGDNRRVTGALERLLAAVESRHGRQSREFAQISDLLGRALAAESRWRDALPHLRASLAVLRALDAQPRPSTVNLMAQLAQAEIATGSYREGEELLRAVHGARRAELGDRGVKTLEALNNLGLFLRERGRFAEAEQRFVQMRDTAEAAFGANHEIALTAWNNLAHVIHDQGRLQEAEPILRRVLQVRRETLGDSAAATIDTLSSLIRNLNDQGRLAEAEQLYRAEIAVRTGTAGPNAEATLRAINDLGNNLNLQRRYEESRRLLSDALARQEAARGTTNRLYLSLLNNLIVPTRDEPARLLPLRERAARLHEEVLGANDPQTLISQSNLAGTLFAVGRPLDAERLYARVEGDLRRQLGAGHPLVLDALVNLTQIRLLLSQGGIQLSGRAEAALESARLLAASDPSARIAVESSLAANAVRRNAASRYNARRGLFADAAWGVARLNAGNATPLWSEAFAALQDATAGTTAEALAVAAARSAAANLSPELERLAFTRQNLLDRWLSLNARETAAIADSSAEAGPLRRQRREQMEAIETELRGVDAELARGFPNYFEFIRPQALTFESARSMLRGDEAALLVVPTSFGTHVMAITRDGDPMWHHVSAGESEMQQHVTALRRNLVCPRGPCGRFDRALAHRLYRALIEPVAPALAGKRHVFIVARGPASALPFAALITAPPQGDDADPAALRASAWLAEAHALIQIPTLQSLALQRRAALPASGAGGFAGFGDPRLTPATARMSGAAISGGRRLAAPEAFGALPRLRYAAAELELLRSALGGPPASVRVGDAATEGAVRAANLSETRVLAFATHGALADEFGLGEPGLVFTPPAQPSESDDGVLAASEIVRLRLNAEFAILSACDTGAGDGRGGDALTGLARAFFYAGARLLLVSHWPIRDDVAPRITVRTVQLRHDDPALSPAEALQRAMREVRNDPDDSAFAHPASWAAFFLVGDGAR